MMRHYYQGVRMLVTGDWAHGGLPLDPSWKANKRAHVQASCACDGQFSENKLCRESYNAGEARELTVCSSPTTVRLRYVDTSLRGLASEVNACSGFETNGRRALVVAINGGLHHGMNASIALSQIFVPELKLAAQLERCLVHSRLHVVVLGATPMTERTSPPGPQNTALGSGPPSASVFPHQADAKVLTFNKHVEHELHHVRAAGTTGWPSSVTFLPLYNLSKGAQKSDVIHHLSDVPLAVAHILLHSVILLEQ